MNRFRLTLIRLFVRLHLSKILNLKISIDKQRRISDRIGRVASWLSPLKPTVERTKIGGIPAEWIRAGVNNVTSVDQSVAIDVADQQLILYFHGGGFILGSCDSHRMLATHISYRTKLPVALIEYRLAPEHPYPAANEDCLSSYQGLLDMGYRAENIIFGGDSAGGFFLCCRPCCCARLCICPCPRRRSYCRRWRTLFIMMVPATIPTNTWIPG